VVKITVDTAFYHISGYFKYENNPKTPLSGLKVTLKKNDSIQGTPYVTGPTGYYYFGGLINGVYDIEVTTSHPSGLWQTWGGVNNTDALIVNNHIQGTTLLATNPPVIRTTASVKVPHPAINNADYLAIRQAAKYQTTGYNYFDIPKWVFSGVTATAGFSGIEISCANVERDFRGLCAGDVNGTFVPGNGYKMAGTNLQLVHQGTIPVATEMTFPVRVETHGGSPHPEIGAITLLLNYDPSQIEITGVEMPDNGGEEPWFESNNGVLNIGWMSTTPIQVENAGTLLLIHARLTEAYRNSDFRFQISDFESENSNVKSETRNLKSEISFALSDNVLSELADEDGNVISDVKLTMPKGENGKTANWQNGKMEVVSVYPNPAKEDLNIEILTESGGPVSLDLVSVHGISALKIPELLVKAGWNKEKINVSGLAPGVYMLKVTCGDVTEIRKVIVSR
jgi:hypothetical protein